MESTEEPTGPADDEIRATVQRLSRRDSSGGRVIECAAIRAEGANAAAIMTWLTEQDWEPEAAGPAVAKRGGYGLHGSRDAPAAQAPRRYVLRADAGS